MRLQYKRPLLLLSCQALNKSIESFCMRCWESNIWPPAFEVGFVFSEQGKMGNISKLFSCKLHPQLQIDCKEIWDSPYPHEIMLVMFFTKHKTGCIKKCPVLIITLGKYLITFRDTLRLWLWCSVCAVCKTCPTKHIWGLSQNSV